VVLKFVLKQTMANAGPSTAPFAKCANGFAQDDRSLSRVFARGAVLAWPKSIWRSGFLHRAAHGCVSGFGRNDGFLLLRRVKIERQKQILPLRGRMTTKKAKATATPTADSSAALRNDNKNALQNYNEMRCGMTNKNGLRNEEQQGMTNKNGLRNDWRQGMTNKSKDRSA
jgi:hypothetical protein